MLIVEHYKHILVVYKLISDIIWKENTVSKYYEEGKICIWILSALVLKLNSVCIDRSYFYPRWCKHLIKEYMSPLASRFKNSNNKITM